MRKDVIRSKSDIGGFLLDSSSIREIKKVREIKIFRDKETKTVFMLFFGRKKNETLLFLFLVKTDMKDHSFPSTN